MFSRRGYIWAATVCAVLVASQPGRSAEVVSENCYDVAIFDLHGSGEAAGQPSLAGASFAAQLASRIRPMTTHFETVPFAAAGGWRTMIDALLKTPGPPGPYYRSYAKMHEWVLERLDDLLGRCTATRVILTGYGQGADVAADTYQLQPWPNVFGIVLFGDPLFNHNDSSAVFGLNVPQNRRNRRVVDGILAEPTPRPAFNSPHMVTFCHWGDPVCQKPANLYTGLRQLTAQHKNYDKFGEPKMAARHFAVLLKTEPSKWASP